MANQHLCQLNTTLTPLLPTWKHISVAYTLAPVSPVTPTCPHSKPITSEAQEVPEHMGGQQLPPASRGPATPSNSTPPGTNKDHTRTTPMLPPPYAFDEKQQKHRWHHQNALRHFLAILAKIGHNYAPNFDDAYPQGVQWDSLGHFMLLAGQEG